MSGIMKLLIITTAYPLYLNKFYASHPQLVGKPYAEQKAALDYDGFGWADFWSNALKPLGYNVAEITANAEHLQRTWAKENGLTGAFKIGLREIVLEQARKFRPEILWFNHNDEDLLKSIRSEIRSIRLVLGWAGSAVTHTNVWHHMDLVLSCAPESVNWLNEKGISAEQLNHGFDPRINERLKKNPKQPVFSFIGQVIRSNHFHLKREQILIELCKKNLGIQIYSPSADMTFMDNVKAALSQCVYGGMQMLKALGFPREALSNLPKVGNIALLSEKPNLPVHAGLKPFTQPAVFGLKMFQLLLDSRIILNIHADSSPAYASNMRLFEATGVGTCMITDWKEKLHELFEIDREVVSFKSAEECAEKVKWLLDHPDRLETIAKAGQERTLKDHTYADRAHKVDRMIRTYI